MGAQEITAQMGRLSVADKSTAKEEQSIGDDELEQFRMEWRQEVKSRRPVGRDTAPLQATLGVVPATQVPPGPADTSSNHNLKGKERDDKVQSSSPTSPKARMTKPTSPQMTTKPVSPITSPLRITRPLPDSGTTTSKSPERDRDRLRFFKTARRLGGAKEAADAVSIYARAVEAEQAGQLNDALNLYRQAFKLDDNVDRAYSRRAKPEEPQIPTSTDLVSAHPPDQQPYLFQRTIQTTPDYEKAHPSQHHTDASGPHAIRPSPLTTMLDSIEPAAATREFLPGEENLPIPINSIPAEVLDHIFQFLDISALEAFGSSCWKARYITAYSETWRRRAEKIYSCPSLDLGVSVTELGRRHRNEWRSVMIEEERVRMDGCYIAVCHYIRPGAGDEWVSITHMITYHRFLRFYPDGTVISFLTTDHPSEVVPTLKPSLRSKGLHIGTYTLIPDPQPVSHRKRSKVLITDLLEPGAVEPKYEFEMELSLRETGRGRWNKLNILDYRSINLRTGEILSLALQHQKPFYFSNAVVPADIVKSHTLTIRPHCIVAPRECKPPYHDLLISL